jgi:serine O-acetyltransferase
MKEAFERTLYFHLDREFQDYPKDLIRSTFPAFETAAPLFCADVRSKYSSYYALMQDAELLADCFRLIQVDITIFAVFLYRLERQIFLDDSDNALLPYLSALMRIRTGIELYYSTDIGSGLNVQHGTGIVIGPRNSIGKDFIIHQGVTIGQQRTLSPNEKITIGDHVILFAGAKVFGNICIGDHVWVGANAVVVKDLPPNGVYVGAPARRIKDLPTRY